MVLKIAAALNALPSFAARKRFCDTNFERLAAGSGRIIYALDDCNVLKLARNTKGIAQNTVEADYGLHDMYDRIVTRVHDADEDARWLVAERAKRIGPKRFRELAGLDLDIVCEYIRRNDPTRRRRSFGQVSLTPEQEVILAKVNDDHPFAGSLRGLVGDFDMPYGDLCRTSSYGEVCRDGQPMVVLTDYGLTHDVYAVHYKRG